jgi:hypothetical protein
MRTLIISYELFTLTAGTPAADVNPTNTSVTHPGASPQPKTRLDAALKVLACAEKPLTSAEIVMRGRAKVPMSCCLEVVWSF